MGVVSAVSSAAQFAKEKTGQGIAGLWATVGSIGMSALGGASREEAEATVHASTLAVGGTLAINGIQKMTSRVAPQEQPRSFFSSATAQLITGTGIVYGALRAGPRMTTYMSFLGTTSMTSAVVIKHGINRIRNGDYWKGLGYTALGAAGIVGSVYAAYQLMGVPQDSYEAYPPLDPFNSEKDFADVPRRRVKLVTVTDGDSDALEGVTASQDELARIQGIERETVTSSQCLNADGKCTPLDFAVQQCEDRAQQGKVVAIMNDRTPITNPNYSLHRMWDQLRMTEEGHVVPAQVVLVQESGADHRTNPNFIFFEVDQKGVGCQFLREALEHRTPSHLESPALDTGLRDQTAIALTMQKDWENTGVLTVLPRDEAHPYRGHIALSTLCEEGADFRWRPGDFFGQPVRCHTSEKGCEEMSQSLSTMLKQREAPIEWTFVMTTNENPKAPDTTVDIARRNHQLMAHMHHGEYVEDTSPMTLRATHPFKDTSGRVYEPGKVPEGTQLLKREAAPYWRKVDFAKRFVDQSSPSVQRIMVHGDTDLLMNPRVDLYEMWKREVGDSGAVMAVASENPHPQGFITNTGFFMLEAGDKSRRLVDYWAKGVDHPSWSPENAHFPTHGWGRTQMHSLHEQTVLDELIKHMKNLPVHVIPTREKGHGYSGVNTYKRDGVLIGGWIPHPFSYDQDQAYPAIIAKPGDAIIQTAGVPRKGHLMGESEEGPLRRRYVTHVQEKLMEEPRYIPIYSTPK